MHHLSADVAGYMPKAAIPLPSGEGTGTILGAWRLHSRVSAEKAAQSLQVRLLIADLSS